MQFGRMDQCGRTAETHDKWALLDALTQAAPDLNLNHRTLSVLKALMSFLPGREISAAPGSAIVFPSNRKLSERLNGMPESTLRRHLGQLVRAGIVSRKNSPNRKRYVRRAEGGAQLAFGFDLAPLACHAEQLRDIALAAAERRARLALLRDEVAVACQQLAALAAEDTRGLLENTRLLLRRKPCEAALSAAAKALEAELARRAHADRGGVHSLAATEMSASSGQNERHIQDSIKPVSDSEGAGAEGRDAGQADAEKDLGTHGTRAAPQVTGAGATAQKPPSDLARLLQACREYRSFFPDSVQDWQDAERIAEKVSPMLGIDLPVLHDARASMGRRAAATAVLCILERMSAIRSPGAYLRRLAQTARAGQFSTAPMLAALMQRQEVGADAAKGQGGWQPAIVS